MHLTNDAGRLPCRSIRRIRPPLVEPVSVVEMKEHLRIPADFADDDLYIRGLISASRQLAEEQTFLTFTATNWQAVYPDSIGCSCIGREFPYAPLLYDPIRFPVTVSYYDINGDEILVDPALLRVDAVDVPGRWRLPQGVFVDWVGPVPPGMAVEQRPERPCCNRDLIVRWWAGVEDPCDVPPQAKAAIMRMVARMYGDRGDDPNVVLQEDMGTTLLLQSIADGRF